jgi:predicted nicotinamide N-methyase
LEIQVWIPDQTDVQLAYQAQENESAFPFWAKLWPAAFALTTFLQDHPHWIVNKKVLELAAGLGLPSLYASHFASSVYCSDYNTVAVSFIKENIALNKITNITCSKIDWALLPDELEWEILLMSDVNYNPENFEVLLQMMHRFLAMGKTILLSTPQRLSGKAFVSSLLPYCKVNEERWHDKIAINVLVLKK